MASRRDIQLDEAGDLLIADTGDFVVGDSDEQHIQDTINASPGWWKEYPGEGVGIIQYIDSPGTDQQLARAIKLALQADGYTVGNPEITRENGTLKINPNATIL